jgi:hypothetical protein
MKRILFILCVASCVCHLYASVCNCQISEYQAKEMAQQSACVRQSLSGPTFTRFTPNFELHDGLLRLHSLSRRRSGEEFFVFNISDTGVFKGADGNIVVISSDHGDRSVTMAVSASTGELFPLYGCSGSDEGLRKLLDKFSLNITSTSDAEELARLWYIAMQDPNGQRLVFNEFGLRKSVEKIFYIDSGSKRLDSRVRRWQKQLSDIHKRSPLGIHAQAEGQEYAVSITSVMAVTRGNPQIVEDTMYIKKNGSYQLVPLSRRYPNGK